MQANKAFVLATIGTMFCATTALADVYQSKTTGNWSSLGTWQILDGTFRDLTGGDTVPGSDDTAAIRATHVVTVDQDTSVDAISIERDAVVEFGSASSSITFTILSTLTLNDHTGGTDPGTLDVNQSSSFDRVLDPSGATVTNNGLLSLSDERSSVIITDDTTFAGAGVLNLDHVDSKVRIEDNDMLTLGANAGIEGAGQIVRLSDSGVAYFENNGMVSATDPNDALVLGANVDLGSSSGTWKATGGGSLQFLRTATSLTGPFVREASGSFFDMDAAIETTDGVTCSGSGTAFDVAVSFTFNGTGSPMSSGLHSCP